MAKKRMFSLDVIDTDLFLEMPITSRLLYYELGMRADDDGFVDNCKKIMKMTGLADDDMKILVAKRFVIPFDSGVIVIRHWRVNNYLRNDRHTPTRHITEKEELIIENDVYELKDGEKSIMLPVGIPTVYTDKISIDKNSIDKEIIKESPKEKTTRFRKPSLDEIENYISEKGLKVSAKQFYDYFETGDWVDSKGQKVKNWKQKLLTWNKYSKDDPVSNKFYDPNNQYENIDGLFANEKEEKWNK